MKRLVIGEKIEEIELSPDEEAAVTARWQANAGHQKPAAPVPVEQRIALLEAELADLKIAAPEKSIR